MKKLKLSFSHLGERDYLDISSITHAFWQAFGPDKRSQTKNLEFRLRAAIAEQCDLLYEEGSKVDSMFRKDALAELRWEVADTPFFGFIFGNGERIVQRDPEPYVRTADYCQLVNDRVLIMKSMNGDTCYNLARMGKYLVGETLMTQVQVVKYYMSHFVSADELIGTELWLSHLNGSKFLKLHCSKYGVEFGHIILRR
jgi:hypothetical protein